jgi:bacillithiol synthase
MVNDEVFYEHSAYFSALVRAYLQQDSLIKPFYNRYPTIENFKAQIIEKQINYKDPFRAVLVDVLKISESKYYTF